jgi:hypothetical protein
MPDKSDPPIKSHHSELGIIRKVLPVYSSIKLKERSTPQHTTMAAPHVAALATVGDISAHCLRPEHLFHGLPIFTLILPLMSIIESTAWL